MSTSKKTNMNEWIYPSEVCEILQIRRGQFPGLKDLLTTRRVPHTRAQYLRSDVEAMAREAIVPSRRSANSKSAAAVQRNPS